MGILNRLFTDTQESKNVAKQRLQMVLIHDRINLSGAKKESMKNDIIDVIARYLEFDTKDLDLNFKQQDDKMVMVANFSLSER